MKLKYQTWMAVLAVLAPFGSRGFAKGPFTTLPELMEETWGGHQILPSTAVPLSMVRGFSLQSEFRNETVRKFLGNQGLHPLLELVSRPSDVADFSGFGLQGLSDLIVHDYNLRASGVEVCEAQFRSVQFKNGEMRVLGTMPRVDAVYTMTADAWDDVSVATGIASSELNAKGFGAVTRVTSSSQCAYALDGELQPAWKLIAYVRDVPFLMYVGRERVLMGYPFRFDGTGTVRAYDTNPTTGTLKDFSIQVNGDGHMTNEYFTTADAGSSGVGRSHSSNNTFTGAPGSSYFAEQSTFAHVNTHFDFVSKNGYLWKGPKPITIKNHFVFRGGDINNAAYDPFNGESGPFILVADGDGNKLKNLPFDSDVASHEFGHHVVFSSVTKTDGESKVIHEGLADALTYLRTGDACLGESICPSTSRYCQVVSLCLRSGTTTMKYNDSTYQSYSGSEHLQSQVISGFVWDLKLSGKIPAADLNKIVFTAITMLPSQADIKSFVVAFLDADYAAFGKKYQSVITEAAVGRGMGTDTLGINLLSIDGAIDGESSDSGSKSKKGFLGLCSVGEVTELGGGSSYVILVLLLIPLIIGATRRRAVPVRVKAKRQR